MLFWGTLMAGSAWLLSHMVTVPGTSYSGPLKPLSDEERLMAENLRRHVVAIASREHNVWETLYTHVLSGENAVAEWVKGTALIPVMNGLKALVDAGAGGMAVENGLHQRFQR